MSHVGVLSLMVIIRRWRLPTICITVGTLSVQSETLACWCYKYMRWIGLYVGAQMATKDQCRLDCSVSISYAAATLITWPQRTAQPLNELDINIWERILIFIRNWRLKIDECGISVDKAPCLSIRVVILVLPYILVGQAFLNIVLSGLC